MFYYKNWIEPHALENIEQYSGKISPYSLNSDQKAFWRCFSNFTKHIWEFIWEKETVLTTTGNAEAKAKNTLVTALRNYNLVVMKAAFLFLQKQDEESSTSTASLAVQPALYLHAFHIHRMDVFLFRNILPNFSSSELHSRPQCTDTWVWLSQTDLWISSLQFQGSSQLSLTKMQPGNPRISWRFTDQLGAINTEQWMIKLVKTDSSGKYFNYQTFSLKMFFFFILYLWNC